LTQLLQASLGGNTNTAFICTVSLAERWHEETRRTLDLATQAKKVRNKPRRNVVHGEKSLLDEAQDEIQQLKAGLQQGGAKEQELQDKIKFLESMVVGKGGAQSLEVLNSMWTPDLGKSALDGSSYSKIVLQAEEKRVARWREDRREEVEKIWSSIDSDGNGFLDRGAETDATRGRTGVALLPRPVSARDTTG
jgi:hypothetical protein